jgi:hypothetical protein
MRPAFSRGTVPRICGLAALVATSPAAAQAQWAASTRVAVHVPPTRPEPTAPALTRGAVRLSQTRLTMISAGVAASLGQAGFYLGWMLDERACRRAEARDPDPSPAFIFGPCDFFFDQRAGQGWYGATLVGATAGAAIMANRNGCPAGQAISRALAGGLAGMIPVGAYFAAGGRGYSYEGVWLALATPVTQGIGAAAAVRGCRGGRSAAGRPAPAPGA